MSKLMKKRESILLKLILIGVLVSSTFVIIYFWPSAANEWDDYTESGIYTASEEVNIGNITYYLETYMWRDFMPISPPDGKPLIVIIKIHVIGVLEFPSVINLERLWLIDGTEIISALPTNEYKVYGNIFEMTFRGGPKWGPGISIDVVVKLKGINFSFYYLKAINQPIHRTD